MAETPVSKFEGWAVVELFGQGKTVGIVTTEYFGNACMFRVDSPGREAREYELERPEYGQHPDNLCTILLPKGTKVKRPAMPAHSRLVGPSAIFAINPCSEDVALRQLERDEPRPLIAVEIPKDLARQDCLPGEIDFAIMGSDEEYDKGEEEPVA